MKNRALLLSTLPGLLFLGAAEAASFSDDFNDGVLDAGWTVPTGGTWEENNGYLKPGGWETNLIGHSATQTSVPFTMSLDFDFEVDDSDTNEEWVGAAWNVGGTGAGASGDEAYVLRVLRQNGRITMTLVDDDGSIGVFNLWASHLNGAGDIGKLTLENTYRIEVTSNSGAITKTCG